MRNLPKNQSFLIMDSSALIDLPKATLESIYCHLKEKKEVLILPQKIHEELLALKSHSEQRISTLATRSLRWLGKLIQEERLQFIQGKGQSHGDFQIILTSLYLRVDKPVTVLTSDQALARDLMRLNDFESSEAFPIYVGNVNKEGYIVWNTPKKYSLTLGDVR